MADDINRLAAAAAEDDRLREQLLKDSEETILRMASAACGQYVDRSDDEWSAALGAFSKAIDRYSPERGDFLPFARVLIRNEIMDLYRAAGRGVETVSLDAAANSDPGSFAGGISADGVPGGNALREEILAANEQLRRYGFRFFDLTECSPRQDRSRTQCAAAVRALMAEPVLRKELEESGKLPIRALAARSGVPRKTLDRYRKYIIMVAVILGGDYPMIADYLTFMRKEDIR